MAEILLANSKEFLSPPTTVVYLFPGQGSQKEGMGKQLVEESQAAANIFHRADNHLGFSLSTICFENLDNLLQSTLYAQPAIYTHSLALHAAMTESGLTPDYVAGHSLGEIPAYVAAGGLDFEQGLDIIQKRAELMDRAGKQMERPGGMGALVGLTEEDVNTLIDNKTVFVANINAPKQIVVSGYKDAIAQLFSDAQSYAIQHKKRFMGKELGVSTAAHSPFMQPVVEEFRDFLKQYDFKVPRVPVILNRTNDLSTDPEKIRDSFADQLTRGVNWVQIQQRLQELGVNGLIEVGPGDVLSRLATKAHFDQAKERILASDKIHGLGTLLHILHTNYST